MSKKMFDFCVGNPPYQDESQRSNGYAAPVYNAFMDAAIDVSDKVELIHPARFLFNAGSTPKDWNKKMLQDEHYKVLHYEKDSSVIFPGVDIKGGVAISYRDSSKVFGAIETFVSDPTLNKILNRIKTANILPLSKYAYVTAKFDFTELKKDHPEYMSLLKERRLATNVLGLLDNKIFFKEKPNGSDEFIRVYGRIGSNRVYRWTKRKYIEVPENLDYYKLFLPKVNGVGAFGELITDPVIGKSGEINTHTFMSIGLLNTEEEAEGLLKYIKTKFARALLGVLKITQHNSNECWRYVPAQDFSEKSDIDWTKSVHEIDLQLYRKYGLSVEEINFIETNVKEMI